RGFLAGLFFFLSHEGTPFSGLSSVMQGAGVSSSEDEFVLLLALLDESERGFQEKVLARRWKDVVDELEWWPEAAEATSDASDLRTLRRKWSRIAIVVAPAERTGRGDGSLKTTITQWTLSGVSVGVARLKPAQPFALAGGEGWDAWKLECGKRRMESALPQTHIPSTSDASLEFQPRLGSVESSNRIGGTVGKRLNRPPRSTPSIRFLLASLFSPVPTSAGSQRDASASSRTPDEPADGSRWGLGWMSTMGAEGRLSGCVTVHACLRDIAFLRRCIITPACICCSELAGWFLHPPGVSGPPPAGTHDTVPVNRHCRLGNAAFSGGPAPLPAKIPPRAALGPLSGQLSAPSRRMESALPQTHIPSTSDASLEFQPRLGSVESSNRIGGTVGKRLNRPPRSTPSIRFWLPAGVALFLQFQHLLDRGGMLRQAHAPRTSTPTAADGCGRPVEWLRCVTLWERAGWLVLAVRCAGETPRLPAAARMKPAGREWTPARGHPRHSACEQPLQTGQGSIARRGTPSATRLYVMLARAPLRQDPAKSRPRSPERAAQRSFKALKRPREPEGGGPRGSGPPH
ncbi:hypothetical protein BN1708_004588, partial [Verticillium longisporum]